MSEPRDQPSLAPAGRVNPTIQTTIALPALDIGPSRLLGRRYKTIRLEWDESRRAIRVRMCVNPIQCYSLAALGELQQVLDEIGASPGMVRHFVLSSDVPQVFNFGGDLALFVLLVRAADLDSLRLYGRRCVDLIWWMENAADLGIHTTALAQGDTLGGGLESLLPFHRVIFEQSALGGFPEPMFNLFPGMGAWEFTTRRSGSAIASEMILSGQIYSAEELKQRHIADVVAPDGEGEQALAQVLAEVDARHRGLVVSLRAQRRASPIRYESLIANVDLWAQAAMSLSDRDLRLMERLARAQARKASGAEEGAVEEIKRVELEQAWSNQRKTAATPMSSSLAHHLS